MNYTWADVVVRFGKTPEDLEILSAGMTEVQHNTSRKNAEKIREEAETWDGWPEKQANMQFTANLIDPETEN